MSRRTLLAAATLAALGGCGLLSFDPEPPTLERALRAKAADAAGWQRLGEALALYTEQGLESTEVFLLNGQEPSVREEILLQDLRQQEWERAQLVEHYDRRYLASGDAVSALLLARVTEELPVRRRLLDEAKKSDPELLLVRVEILANEPFRVGDKTVIERLVKLLDREPGLAEGWRLLRELGPRYGQPDLAVLAAELEPWCPQEDPRAAQLDQVRTCLAAGRARRALEKLDAYRLEGRAAQLLRASALAETGRAPEAWELLLAMQQQSPQDAILSFNLGLLARDYLAQPARAAVEFERFLQLMEARRARGEQVDEFRVLQAQVWLWQHQNPRAQSAELSEEDEG